MAFKAGDTVFIVESNRFIREAEVRSCSGGMYLVKFKDNGGGMTHQMIYHADNGWTLE